MRQGWGFSWFVKNCTMGIPILIPKLCTFCGCGCEGGKVWVQGWESGWDVVQPCHNTLLEVHVYSTTQLYVIPRGFRLWLQLMCCTNLLYVSEYFIFRSEAQNWEQKLI